MKLTELIKGIEVIKILGDLDVEVTDVKIDSNIVTKGCLFVCVKGHLNDGHEHVKQAEKFGACAIISEKEVDCAIPQIIVSNTRKALSKISSAFYFDPSEKLSMVAVIGTNGKTTTSHLIYQIMKENGVNCGVIGTLGSYYGKEFVEPTLTTPDPMELNKLLAEMLASGVSVVVMEVSAHAIYWDKVYGINFDVAVFTNFSRDHLDFFQDIEEYKQAKLKFFNENVCKYLVVNSDDQVGIEICAKKKDVITYGIENPADVFAIKITERANSTSFVLNLFDCIYNIDLPMVGYYNVSNALASATATSLLGIKPDKVCEALLHVKGVSGRLERVYDGEFKVFIDYAHTPDGLFKVLTALKPIAKNKLIVVFGCGGNRDRGKRAEMGEIAKRIADFVVVTSDNPRYEEPMSIISEIESGILKSGKEYVLIEDRTSAIEYAINYASSGDLVVVAGKGGENYQDVLGIKHPYNDKDTVIEIIARGQR